jgi:hypothetical protein
VTCRRLAPDGSDFAGVGFCEEREVVKARFSLRHWNLCERHPERANIDARIVAQARARFAQLYAA